MEDFNEYLIEVGIQSIDFNHSEDIIYKNISYFRRCFNKKMKPYSALLFLNDYINHLIDVPND